tara:strand:- start:99 stop:755 length:657 start_codon:yes stop_codon:yes gene_type:complete
MKTLLKTKAVSLRKDGLAITKIADILNVSKSTISLWVKDIILSDKQKISLKNRSKVSSLRSLSFKDKRKSFQSIGSKRIYTESDLYIAGCMLYWGEGTKGKNYVRITNSDIAMLILFKKFVLTFFDVKNEDFKLSINCYTDYHDIDVIQDFWISKLDISSNNLKKSYINNIPSSSKCIKKNKLEWGTASLSIYRTDIVQEIYGAIQEYASFNNDKWLG